MASLAGVLTVALFASPAAADDPAPPSSPQEIRVEPQADGSLSLTWQPPADDGGSPIQGYKVERHGAGGWGLVGVTPVEHILDSEAGDPAQPFVVAYRVTAFNAAGDGASTLSISLVSLAQLGSELGLRGASCYVVETQLFPLANFINGTCLIVFLTSQSFVPQSVNNQAQTTLLFAWAEIRQTLKVAEASVQGLPILPSLFHVIQSE